MVVGHSQGGNHPWRLTRRHKQPQTTVYELFHAQYLIIVLRLLLQALHHICKTHPRRPSSPGNSSTGGHPVWASTISLSLQPGLHQGPHTRHTPLGSFEHHIQSHVRVSHHSTSSPSFSSGRLWEGRPECTLVEPAQTTALRPSIQTEADSHSGVHDRPCPPHPGITLSTSVRSP